MTLKRYAILPNGLKGKFRKLWGLIPTFVKVRGVKLVGRGGGVASSPFPIQNRVKDVRHV